MRVVFLTADPDSASARVRVHEHLPALAAGGVDAAVWTIPRGAAARLRTWGRLRDVDAVVLHRKLLHNDRQSRHSHIRVLVHK